MLERSLTWLEAIFGHRVLLVLDIEGEKERGGCRTLTGPSDVVLQRCGRTARGIGRGEYSKTCAKKTNMECSNVIQIQVSM